MSVYGFWLHRVWLNLIMFKVRVPIDFCRQAFVPCTAPAVVGHENFVQLFQLPLVGLKGADVFQFSPATIRGWDRRWRRGDWPTLFRHFGLPLLLRVVAL